jgi:hypothetical protein
MGTWGVGMQCSDAAMDIIGSTGMESLKTLKSAIKGKATFLENKEILALADHCLDNKIKLPTDIKDAVLHCIESELSDTDGWSSPEDRKSALKRFRDRVNGKKVDEVDLAIDNIGLFDSIYIGEKSRDEIKMLLKKKKGKKK